MGNSFSFADLIPEPLTYRDDVLDGDGMTYAVQVRELLSTEALVQFIRIERQVQGITLDGEEREADAERIDALTDQMMAILIPTLPAERRQIIPLQLRMKFLLWWREAQGDAGEDGGADGPNAV